MLGSIVEGAAARPRAGDRYPASVKSNQSQLAARSADRRPHNFCLSSPAGSSPAERTLSFGTRAASSDKIAPVLSVDWSFTTITFPNLGLRGYRFNRAPDRRFFVSCGNDDRNRGDQGFDLVRGVL